MSTSEATQAILVKMSQRLDSRHQREAKPTPIQMESTIGQRRALRQTRGRSVAEIKRADRAPAPSSPPEVEGSPPGRRVPTPVGTVDFSSEARAGRTTWDETIILATAVYLTGSASLKPGYRYAIATYGSRFRVLGPLDIDPTIVALDRPAQSIEASDVEGRLLVSESNGRSSMTIAFMSVAGPSTRDLAETIRRAAVKPVVSQRLMTGDQQ